MSARELVVLGTASQAPTRHRNHNGYLLRWDDEAVLFDPGEGTQRQMILAGVRASQITRICITHFHGDHCLGLPGVVQRLSLDGVTRPVHAWFPVEGAAYFDRLRWAAAFHETAELVPHPSVDGAVDAGPPFRLTARRLDHHQPTLGWRIDEPGARRLVPERLEAAGIEGPAISRLQAEGHVVVGGRPVTVDEVSEPRPGQSMAFVMDTRLCDAAFELAAGVDLLVCESTFLDAEAELARDHGHLTARQAARIAVDAGARRLVLTHFSQRHPDEQVFLDEARREADAAGADLDVVAAHDLRRVAVPPRRFPPTGGG